ncbi:hypothetical protein VaNZ11_015446 [Volvox africanus]|uniref:GTP cyclohydrolase 1 n=1 Tax=Volvox africanus TaxID=51714 RepID=A0ABQ5SLM8_9CHLO|nr:hypothetical protein VaNZ11_015446 [Volvox africanus]
MSPIPRDREKLTRMEQAVRVLIQGLGEDLDREGLRDTPKRVAKALLDCTQGYHQDTSSTLGSAIFHEPIVHQGGEGVVVVRDIDFASSSEETLLPFHGRCHVAYRPKGGVVLGLSKLARLTKQYAKRLQTQERLAAAIALALQQSLDSYGVAVVLNARHLSNDASPEERTNACVSGDFASKGSPEFEELLALLDLEDLPQAAVAHLDSGGFHSTHMTQHIISSHAAAASAITRSDPGFPAPGTPDPSEKDADGDSDDLVLDLTPCSCEEMEAAVQRLLVEMGENPHRQGLAGAARRYVMSLLASTSGYHMQLPLTLLQRRLLEQPPQRLHGTRELERQGYTYGHAASRENRDLDGECLDGECHVGGGGLMVRTAATSGCVHEDYEMGTRSCNVLAGKGINSAEGSAAVGRAVTAVEAVAGSPVNDGALGAALSFARCRCPGDATACRSCGSPRAGTVSDTARTLGVVSATAAVAGDLAARCCMHSVCCRSQFNGQTAVSTEAVAVPLTAKPLGGAVILHLPFTSQCEHHMLPFYGNLMVAYLPPEGASVPITLPGGVVERVVLMFTQRLQVQERITHQVADAMQEVLQAAAAAAAAPLIMPGLGDRSACVGDECTFTGQHLQPSCNVTAVAKSGTGPVTGDGGEATAGVMVVCDAAHMCMVARGVENHSGSTTTFAMRGLFTTRPELRCAVLRLFREHQIKLAAARGS